MNREIQERRERGLLKYSFLTLALLPLLLFKKRVLRRTLFLVMSPDNGIPPLQVDFKKPVKTRHVQFVKFLGEGQSIFF